MVSVTRKGRFTAGVREHRPDAPAPGDLALPDARERLSWHHYVVQATVEGPVEPATGMVLNIVRLKAMLTTGVADPLEGEFLTPDHPFCRGRVPTIENLSLLIWGVLETALQAAEPLVVLRRVRLRRSRSLAADCVRGDEKPMVLLTRTYEFCAAHRLHSPELSEEANAELFGKCNNPAGHGHNYILDVTVCGDIDPQTGSIVDLARLDSLVNTEVVDRYDHKNFNLDLPEFSGVNPTTENLVRVIWDRLAPLPRGCVLHEVAVHETDRNTFSYSGERE